MRRELAVLLVGIDWADCVDVEHQPTDLAVGGSNPSRRAKLAGQGCYSKESRRTPDSGLIIRCRDAVRLTHGALTSLGNRCAVLGSGNPSRRPLALSQV